MLAHLRREAPPAVLAKAAGVSAPELARWVAAYTAAGRAALAAFSSSASSLDADDDAPPDGGST